MRRVLANPLLVFARRWFRAPTQIGAIAPSSRHLAAAMAAALPNSEGRVIELGPGTGAITMGLLAAGVASADLLLIEKDPFFVSQLQNQFPATCVAGADAADMEQLLPCFLANNKVRAVVSSLPLRVMEAELQYHIFASLLSEVGAAPIIQYSYGLRSPVHYEVAQALQLKAERVKFVWANLPPASVWRYWPAASRD